MSFSLDEMSWLQALGLFAVGRLCYLLVHRLYFHPLKQFPGPTCAALTDYYSGYYEIWQDGSFVKKTEELHKIYGPIVRIRPNELHFGNPEAYFDIYKTPSYVTKEPSIYKCFNVAGSSFGILDPKKHQKRRGILNPLFSRKAILKLESVVQDKIDLFLSRLSRDFLDKPVNLCQGFKAAMMDIVTTYCYAHSFNGLDDPGFNHPILGTVEHAVPIMTITRHFPVLHALNWLPDSFINLFESPFLGIVQMRSFLSGQVDRVLKNKGALTEMHHETIYHHLVTPELLKSQEVPSKQALMEEAIVLLIAGTDTSSNAMSMGFFHMLSHENAQQRLADELKAAWPDKTKPFTFEMAEKLPYLTAVIKESLRLSIGIPFSLPRLVHAPIVVDGVNIPPGVVIGQASSTVLKSPTIFPEPNVFRPERWLEPDSAKLDRYLVVFSRGPRQCLGMNLAWCELYLVFSHVVRNFEMKVYNTTAKDMEFQVHAVPIFRGRPLHTTIKKRDS